MMGKKRGRKPGFTFAKPTSSPSTPLANDYGPSAFVSGELPTNNGAKTGPKFGPRITSLEEEMDLFQEKIDGLGYEHKVLMAEINIINDFIKERFGVQLINQDSQILKLLQLSDGVQDLSKALALPRTKQATQPVQQRPAAPRRNMQPYLPPEDVLDYDDDYAEQVDPYNQFGQYNNYGGSRKNIGYLRDTKITKYKMIDMQLAPNQPLEIEQSGDEEEEVMEEDMDGTEEEQADFQGEDENVDENYDNEQKEEGDYDEVDGEQEEEADADASLDVKENGVTDKEKYPAPPPLVPGKVPSSEVMKEDEDGEEGENEAEQPMDDEDDEQTEEGTQATGEEEVKDEPEDEDDLAANSNTTETETDPEAVASRSRSEEQEPSPTRSNSRTRTRVAKAPKRYRDEDEPAPKHSKPKPPKQRMITTPKTPLTKPTPIQQQRRKSIPAQQPAVQQKQPTLRFNCMFPDCGKYFPTKDQLTKHHQLHKSKPATLTQEDIEKLTCEYCSKIFSSTWNLKTHYRTHTGEKPYPCNYCGQRFAYNQSRELHERHNHTLERPYVCNYCGKSFCASGELGSHLGRVHQRSYQENKEQLMEMEKYEDVDQEEDDDDGPPQLIRSAPMPSVPKRGRPPGRGGQQQRGDFGSHFLCYD